MRVRFALAVLFGLATPARAQDIPTSPDAILDAAKEAEFFASVAIGDRERAAGHVPEAALAYARALRIRQDAVIAGRLGVLLVQAEKYGQAVDLLQVALKHSRAPAAERETYFRAYEVARNHGAWVDIIISQAGAAVALDGDPRNPGGYSAFSIFIVAGEHRLSATLEGFFDATVPFTVRAGEDMQVIVPLRPLLRKLARPATPCGALPALSTNVVGDPNYDSKEDPFRQEATPGKTKDEAERRRFRGSIFAGPVVVFGVASWMPAVGAVIGANWQPNQYFSLGLEGRAAWLTAGVGGKPISAMTAGGLLSACGHVEWFFGCALGHLGVTNIEFGRESYVAESYSFFKPAAGGRIGADLRFTRSVSAYASIDALGFPSGIKVIVGQTIIADQPPIMIGAQIGGRWTW